MSRFYTYFDYIENGTLPEDDKAARKLIFESEQFVINDGIVYNIFTSVLNVGSAFSCCQTIMYSSLAARTTDDFLS